MESLVRLKQLYENDLSGYILEVVSGYLVTGDITGASFETGSLGSAFYPLNQNPSGYITPSQTGQFALAVNLTSTGQNLISYVNAVAYPNTNPSDFVTFSEVTGLLSTGLFLVSNINWIDNITTGEFMSFIQNYSFKLSGPNSTIQLYNTNANPDGNRPYVSGFDVWAYNINCTGINGQPILTSGYITGSFIPISKVTKGQAGQGFNYFLLTDTTLSTNVLFDAGYNFYALGRNTVQVSWPYIIDFYGSQTPNYPSYNLTSGYPYILGFDLYSNNIIQSGYRVLTTNDLTASGVVLTPQLLALSGYLQANDNRQTTAINNLQAATGTYYPNTNPSGFITQAQAGGVNALVVTGKNISGVINIQGTSGISVYTGAGTTIDIGLIPNQFYPLTGNPSGFVQNSQTGNFVTNNQTGNFVTTNQTGKFYPANNPSGFITAAGIQGVNALVVNGVQISGNVGVTGVGNNTVYMSGNNVVISGNNNYYPTSNPSGYITTGQTGNFAANTGQLTGIFYPLTGNPSGFLMPDDTGNFVDLTSVQTVSGLKDFFGGLATSFISGDPNSYQGMVDGNGVLAVDWANRQLFDSNDLYVVNWDTKQLFTFEQVIIDWGVGVMYDNNITYNGLRSVDWWNRQLVYNVVNGVTATSLDWQKQILSGLWTGNSGAFTSSLTISGVPVSTGNVNTGTLAAVFYPLNGNPSGFITTGQTGNFVTNNQTGNFVTTNQTGNFGGVTGNFVHITGKETISGVKDFSSGLAVSYISGDSNYTGMVDTNGNTSVDWNNRGLSGNWTISSSIGAFSFSGLGNPCYIFDNAGLKAIEIHNRNLYSFTGFTLAGTPELTLDWHNCILSSNILFNGDNYGTSLNWHNRQLFDTGQVVSLDWNARLLSGSWTGYNLNLTGALTINGVPVLTGVPTGTYLFSTPISSGLSQQFISFPTTLSSGAAIICTLNNYSGTENIFSQVSGITPTGFWATFSQTIDGSGYLLTTLASIGGTSASLSTNVIINSGNLMGYSPSLSYNTGINWSLGTAFVTTLTGNATMTFSNSSDGMSINVLVRNTGNATYTVTWPSGATGVKWSQGLAPVQTTGNGIDIYTFVNFTGVVYGSVVQNML